MKAAEAPQARLAPAKAVPGGWGPLPGATGATGGAQPARVRPRGALAATLQGRRRAAPVAGDDSDEDGEEVEDNEPWGHTGPAPPPRATPLPKGTQELKALLFNAAWRKVEDSEALAPAGDAASKELARLCERPLRTGREKGGAELRASLDGAKASALDRLEREYISSKGVLERGGAEPDVVLGRLAATVAKVIEGLHADAEGAAAVLAARLAKEHKELLTVMKAATNRMVGELVDEAKQGLHTRHNWRAAEVVKKLEGAQMAARSAAEADCAAELAASAAREAKLEQQLRSSGGGLGGPGVDAETQADDDDAVRNSFLYMELRDERDGLAVMVQQLVRRKAIPRDLLSFVV